MSYEAYGKGVYGPYFNAGAPVAGTNEVQTGTFAGTWLAGDTYRLSLDGRVTAPIPWNATTATHLASIQAALDTISGAANNIVVTAGTIAAGLGTVLFTFSGGDCARRNMNNLAVTANTSAAGTLAIAETTPGVSATGRNVQMGSTLVDTSTGKIYISTGAPGNPTWVSVGSQS